jgi:hypothetical protein
VETVVEGVKEVGGVSGICNEEIRSAGLGNVLYVEPREVYLRYRGDDEPSCVLIDWQKREPLTLDHTTCSREH